MKFFCRAICCGLAWGTFSLGQPGPASCAGVKTHFKQYTVFTYEQKDYLCEPYQVKKNDWLYKIFRQKGEISASDFPKFLKIFKTLNPHLSNIDAIAAGIEIMIPLKEVEKEAYSRQDDGIVEVPVLEFSLKLTRKTVDGYIRNHLVQQGDTVSNLLDRKFRKKGGALSKIGEQTFASLNPHVKNIDRIYTGSHLLIPEADILSQPWLETLLQTGYQNLSGEKKAAGTARHTSSKALQESHSNRPRKTDNRQAAPPLQIFSPEEISRLKRYAQLIQGTIRNRGKVFFPGKNGEPARILDLTQLPVLEDSTGAKTLVLPTGTKDTDLDQDLIKAVKSYWKGVQLQQLHQTLSNAKTSDTNPMDRPPASADRFIARILTITPYTYGEKVHFPVTLKHMQMSIALGRITHENEADILVNTGNIYGKALDLIEQQGYTILSLTPDRTMTQIILEIFSKLGYETWQNPSFYDQGQVKTIQGIFANKGVQKYFFTATPPLEDALKFLEGDRIQLIILDRNT